jgi:hypothetical protein
MTGGKSREHLHSDRSGGVARSESNDNLRVGAVDIIRKTRSWG